MRRSNRGFTLIETLITTAIMVSGLVAVATVFSYSVATNFTNQQRTAGTMLLYEKMEIFKATSLANSMWNVGGNLTPASPATGYFDYVTIGSNGALTTSTSSTTAPYMRIWQVTGTTPRQVTIIVYARRSGVTRSRLEVARATTLMTNTF